MMFQWPEMLWLLLALPLLVALYLWLLGRKKKFALRYASLDIVKEAMGSGIGWRRHVPPLIFLLGLAVLILAIARPTASVLLPSQHETIILAMDVSGSMRATDVEPNRLVAAQNAAKAFVAEVPDTVRIGVVAFAGTATVAQAPTRNREDVIQAIDRFQLQRATAIGSAIIVSLATLFPDQGLDVANFSYGADPRKNPKLAAHRPVLPGSYQSAVIILAMDVSGSMRATDVEPNRLVAAQNAAKAFIAETPENVMIGVVAFAGTATVAQAPTRNKEEVVAAIDRFQLQRATAIGSAILVSLATIFPNTGIDVATFAYPDPKQKGSAIAPSNPAWPKPVAAGSYNSAVIILLTDGQRTTGPDSIQTARLAADRGVRVYTVGIGTVAGETIGFEGWSMHVRLDEETLKTIADVTRGEYFYAGSAADLKKVYQNLNSKLVLETRKTEITALFAAAAALLALGAALLSVLWFNRIL